MLVEGGVLDGTDAALALHALDVVLLVLHFFGAAVDVMTYAIGGDEEGVVELGRVNHLDRRVRVDAGAGQGLPVYLGCVRPWPDLCQSL